MLERTSGTDIASSYQRLLHTLDKGRILINDAALLVIDPQRSFTQGVWMQSIGDEAAVDVEPIAAAFKNCSRLLNEDLWPQGDHVYPMPVSARQLRLG